MSASSAVDSSPTWAPRFQSILRIAAAFIFTLSGTSKILAFPVGMPGGATAHPFTQVWIAGMLELVGGPLLFLGLFTRPVAFLLSGEMAVAYFQYHFPKSFWPTVNGGSAAALFSFIWLYMSVAGAGPWSLDAMLRRRP